MPPLSSCSRAYMQKEGETHSRACTPQSMTMPARRAPSLSEAVTISMGRPSCVVPIEDICAWLYLDCSSLANVLIWSK